ncbi:MULTISPECIES: hypothetical protein [unclassified Novosphingobium]|uniref:hypothetical protein n=1 Tax=Novosphingobium TaxID=165696 RepID=UPI00144566D9|nr:MULTISPECIES: hypothetical protein [unclassified Novosphingobium]NKJ43744.1 hypothetical protein [Novosphingobium sp. SG720]NMN06207.1 hypothetical protein [Novosphingobium sp. SG919]NMN88504.1 hypothetical protein [Novosphingobium sp. SG916]
MSRLLAQPKLARRISRQPASLRVAAPLPHPSWGTLGAARPDGERPSTAEEFFRRLGL